MTNFKTLAFFILYHQKSNIGDLQSKYFLLTSLQNCHLMHFNFLLMFFSCCLAVFSDHKEKLKFYGSFVFAPLGC